MSASTPMVWVRFPRSPRKGEERDMRGGSPVGPIDGVHAMSTLDRVSRRTLDGAVRASVVDEDDGCW